MRNVTLDWFKIILSILVVCIHSPALFAKDSMLTSYFGSTGFTTIAVPCFLIINGYFFYKNLNDSKAFKGYMTKICIMFLIWSTLYLPLYYDIMPLKYIITMFFTGYFHLWYMSALILGVALLYFIYGKIKNIQTVLAVATICYIAALYLKSLHFEIKTISIVVDFIYNIFTGFFFIAVGALLKEKVEIDNLQKKPLLLFTSVFFIFFVLVIINPTFKYPFEKVITGMSLGIICPLIFLSVMRLSVTKPNTSHRKYLSNISAGIYFSHLYLAIRFFPFWQKDYNIVVLPIFIAMTVLISAVLIILNRKVKYLL